MSTHDAPAPDSPAPDSSELEREKLRAEVEALKLSSEKLRQDLKSARLSKWIAVITGLASAVVAIASHWTDITAVFVPKPRTTLEITTDDEFLRSTAIVQVDESDRRVSLKFEDARSIELSPGPHKVTVIVGDAPVMSTDLVLASGESKRLQIDGDVLRKVHVAVSDKRREVHAGESMELTVTASGAGHVWIFRSEAAGKCSLAFPFHADGTVADPGENFIDPQRPVSFPRPGPHGALLAPTVLGPAKLYVIVTSIDDANQATGIVGHYCETSVARAAMPDPKDNWGMQVVAFTVN